jgi:Mrp family chromosome partitioning ATPase
VSGIVVWGAAGGVGTTTLACALALSMATGDDATDPPVLVDADAHGGGPLAMWGIRAERGLDDLAALGADLGAGHVAQVRHRHPAGVDVMGGHAGPVGCGAWTPDAARVLADIIAGRDAWVVDAGRGDDVLAAALAARAGTTAMLVPRSLDGVQRARERAHRRGAPAPSVLVVCDGCGADLLGMRAARRALADPSAIALPRDVRAAAHVRAGQRPRGRGLAGCVAALRERP